jgi:hypothetical protein
MFELPKKIFPLPAYRESVDQAVSAENLKAIGSETTDPEIVLGRLKAGSAVSRQTGWARQYRRTS